jgi:hypothetical protein
MTEIIPPNPHSLCFDCAYNDTCETAQDADEQGRGITMCDEYQYDTVTEGSQC